MYYKEPLVHPLRKSLTKKDLIRIQDAIDNDEYSDVTTEELDAANDIFYDAIVTKLQTHEGSLARQ